MIDPKELQVGQTILFYELEDGTPGSNFPMRRKSNKPERGKVISITKAGYLEIQTFGNYYDPKYIEVVEVL
jgi:hypothetical protein